jgi:hypothetical protein
LNSVNFNAESSWSPREFARPTWCGPAVDAIGAASGNDPQPRSGRRCKPVTIGTCSLATPRAFFALARFIPGTDKLPRKCVEIMALRLNLCDSLRTAGSRTSIGRWARSWLSLLVGGTCGIGLVRCVAGSADKNLTIGCLLAAGRSAKLASPFGKHVDALPGGQPRYTA